MNCQACRHRRSLPYSHHSSCEALPLPAAIKAMALAMHADQTVYRAIGVTISAHGFKHGWACWPVDFDPIWIEDCQYFDPIPDQAAAS